MWHRPNYAAAWGSDWRDAMLLAAGARAAVACSVLELQRAAGVIARVWSGAEAELILALAEDLRNWVWTDHAQAVAEGRLHDA